MAIIYDNQLEDKIIDFIKQKENADSIDICTHFIDTRVDMTYTAIKNLEMKHRITRVNHFAEGWNGNHHYKLNRP